MSDRSFKIEINAELSEKGVVFSCNPSQKGEFVGIEQHIYNATFHKIKASLIEVTEAIKNTEHNPDTQP